MKKTVTLFLILISFSTMALYFTDAQIVAKSFLNVTKVGLESESTSTYFFTTELEFTENDIDKLHPCIRGVLISKKRMMIVNPKENHGIEIFFPYSDTRFVGNIVINCAD